MMIDSDYDQNLEVHVQRDLDIEKIPFQCDPRMQDRRMSPCNVGSLSVST